jgi:sugar phosphate isomerase/epimerase
MKLSASNLGCFKWDIPTTIARLRDYGFGGLDLRGVSGNMKPWTAPEFSSGIAETGVRLQDAGIVLSCISSSIVLSHSDPAKIAAADEELERDAGICAALGCRQIRVFGGDLRNFSDNATEADRDRVVEHIAERSRSLAERARSVAPVDILIETHDAWTNSEHMARALELTGRGDVGCCWDVKHTYWTAKEVPAVTWSRIARWTRNTHWKDVRRNLGGRTLDAAAARLVASTGFLCPTGSGIAPLADCVEMLDAAGYDGWYTLEWEKHWHPRIEEPEVAFPAFVRFMREARAAILRQPDGLRPRAS